MSVKTAVPDHPILDLFKERWSPRAFTAQPIELAKIRSIFEAARWAASSANEQPWRFIVGLAGDGTHRKLASCLAPTNALWAPQAPVLAMSVASLKFTLNGNPNRVAVYDVGAAAAHLSLQAVSMGIYTHQMAGFDVAKACQAFEIPEGYDPVAMIAMGYLGDPATLNEKQQQMELAPRTRKPLAELLFSDKWGVPAERLLTNS
jgi:nitroreductase